MSQPIRARYTLEECYRMLDIHPKTFRIWLTDAHITPETSKADKRIKFLTAAQVEQLARWHEKPWPPEASTQGPEVIRPEAYKLLVEQLAEADRQAQQIGTEQSQLREQIGATSTALEQVKTEQVTLHAELHTLRKQELEPLRQDTAAQLAAIQQRQDEQEQADLERSHTVLEMVRLATTMLKEIDAAGQETKTRVDVLFGTAGRHQQEIAALQTGQNQARADLDAIMVAIEEQAQRLEQLRSEAQRSAQEQLEQAQAAMKAEFQAALTAMRKEIQATIEQQARELAAAIQSAEQDGARDVAALTAQQEQLQTQVKNVATKAEAATTTALGGQRRIDGVEQQLATLDKRVQAEQEARVTLVESVNRLAAQQVPQALEASASEPPQERKKPSRKPKQTPAT